MKLDTKIKNAQRIINSDTEMLHYSINAMCSLPLTALYRRMIKPDVVYNILNYVDVDECCLSVLTFGDLMVLIDRKMRSGVPMPFSVPFALSAVYTGFSISSDKGTYDEDPDVASRNSPRWGEDPDAVFAQSQFFLCELESYYRLCKSFINSSDKRSALYKDIDRHRSDFGDILFSESSYRNLTIGTFLLLLFYSLESDDNFFNCRKKLPKKTSPTREWVDRTAPEYYELLSSYIHSVIILPLAVYVSHGVHSRYIQGIRCLDYNTKFIDLQATTSDLKIKNQLDHERKLSL